MSDENKRPEINTEWVCRIVVKAREFDVKEDAVEEESGSNPDTGRSSVA